MHALVYMVVALIVVPVFVFLMGVRIVRPTHKGLVERLGKYRRFAHPGFNWILERDNINGALLKTLSKETMNKVVKAENEKVAALDFANAVEGQAGDGSRKVERHESRRRHWVD